MGNGFKITYSTPEEVGIKSANAARLIEGIVESKMHLHSILLMRRGKVFLEGYAEPFTKDTFNRAYSASKSFVSGAIGMLVDDGKITLDDRVIDHFPEFNDDKTHDFIKEATVRDLLTMRSPHNGTTHEMNDTEWLSTFFRKEPVRHPGSEFHYDTSATYVLDVLVERITGKPFLEFMKERFPEEMEFSKDSLCIKSPDGYSWGGSGVLLTTLDLAKYAQIFLGGGKWGDKQVLSEEYVADATSHHANTYRDGMSESFIEGNGYGYYIWKTPYDSFSFLGMGDQVAVCFPKQDMVAVWTADNQGVGGTRTVIFELINKYILSDISSSPIAEDDAGRGALNAALDSLCIPVPDGSPTSTIADKINGRKYVFGDDSPFSEITLRLDGEVGRLDYKTAKGERTLSFGICKYQKNELPEKDYSGLTIGIPYHRGYNCISAGAWKSDDTFVIRTDVTDIYLGNMTMTFTFSEDKVTLKSDVYAEAFLTEYDFLAEGVAE